MVNFKQRLNELIKEKDANVEDLKKFLNLKSASLIYFWLNGTYTPKLNYLNKLANFFECSIDYLLGQNDNLFQNNILCNNLPDFNKRLEKILDNKNLTQKTLRKENIISGSLYRSIFKRKSDPTIETLIKLANYLNVSIDYLVGRE